jgi:hypothetical protein
MTTQEAIELLDNLIGMIEDNHNNDYDKAFRMAIEALEKQDAKKPIKVLHEDVKVNWNSCPTCKQGIGWGKKRDVNNCWNCGQKLDWGEE